MYQLDETDIKLLQQTEEGKMYLRYHEVTKGEPLGMMIPFGYPDGVEERGGVIKVYEECIKKGVTWEELLGYNDPENDDLY